MAVPSTIRAGDTIVWIEPPGVDGAGEVVDSSTWTATAYLRFNKAAEGITVTGAARSDGGWDFTISATTSATMDAGAWVAQVVATQGAERLTLAASSVTVLADLAYTGTPGAFDGRSALITKGAQSYAIGSRSYTALDLGRLTARESQLRGIVAREQAAAALANGRADGRNVFVRFS